MYRQAISYEDRCQAFLFQSISVLPELIKIVHEHPANRRYPRMWSCRSRHPRPVPLRINRFSRSGRHGVSRRTAREKPRQQDKREVSALAHSEFPFKIIKRERYGISGKQDG